MSVDSFEFMLIIIIIFFEKSDRTNAEKWANRFSSSRASLSPAMRSHSPAKYDNKLHELHRTFRGAKRSTRARYRAKTSPAYQSRTRLTRLYSRCNRSSFCRRRRFSIPSAREPRFFHWSRKEVDPATMRRKRATSLDDRRVNAT